MISDTDMNLWTHETLGNWRYNPKTDTDFFLKTQESLSYDLDFMYK